MLKKILSILFIICSTQVCVLTSPYTICYINKCINNSNNLFNDIIKIQLYIYLFILFQYKLTFLPGKYYYGPKSTDNRQILPIYKENGVKAFLLTCISTSIFCKYKIINYVIIYNNIYILWLSLNFYALILCIFLYKFSKLKLFNDYNSNIEKFYLGQELYPIINNINIKFFTNCRFGMMLWPTLLIIYMFNHYENNNNNINLSMLSNFSLQMIYIFKFFYWESGYMNSLDIIHDKAGYYICWGCIVWVTSFYTLSSYYLIKNEGVKNEISLYLLIIGLIGIILNYWCDYQKIIFRKSKGNCKIFFSKPSYIVVRYKNDENNTNLLLTSGFWGISRHFNYVLELIASYAWSLNCNSIFGLIYPIYLTVLLIHRCKRDNIKCSNKYSNWNEYCKIVKYKLIPYIY